MIFLTRLTVCAVALFFLTSSTSLAALTTNLQRGDAGEQVLELQRILQSQGDYPYQEITGHYDLATEDAVKQFQARNGIVSSGSPEESGWGSVGSRTRAALMEAARSPSVLGETYPPSWSSLRLGSEGEDVKKLQQFLKEQGYFQHPSLTGYFGLLTENALARYQESVGARKNGRFSFSTSTQEAVTKTTTTTSSTKMTLSLTTSAREVAYGGATVITWSSTGAKYCKVRGPGFSNVEGLSGSKQTPALTKDAKYRLTCTNERTGKKKTTSVRIDVAEPSEVEEEPEPTPTPTPAPVPPAPTVTLTATPSSLTGSGTTKLQWSATNASSCTASSGWSGTKPVSGTATVSLSTTTEFFIACVGQGGTGGASAKVSVTAVPTPTPTPTPTPSPDPAPSASSQAPTLYLETNPGGGTQKYLRVEEQKFAFPGTPDKTLKNYTIQGRLRLQNGQKTDIQGITGSNTDYAIYTTAGVTNIYNYTFNKASGYYAAALSVGENQGEAGDIPTTGITYMQRAVADGKDTTFCNYNGGNHDFIASEFLNKSTYVRDATGLNFGDAGVDTKSPVYLQNVTLDNSCIGLKIWPTDFETNGYNEIVIANSIVNNSRTHVEFDWDDGPMIKYYNTLWCNGVADPSPTNPGCSYKPTKFGSDGPTIAEVKARTQEVTTNPLPALSPFFKTAIDHIRVEYSTDGGTTWTEMELANGGGNGKPPLGDTRYAIPSNLSGTGVKWRAWYEKNGAKVGNTSAVLTI